VRVTDDYAAEDFSSDSESLGDTTALATGQRVMLADGYDEGRFSNDSGNRLMLRGDTVRLEAASFEVSGSEQLVDIDNGMYVLESGDTYRFLGASDTDVDLGDEDFTDSTRWELIKGDAGALYRYIGPGGRGLRIDLGSEDYTDSSKWVRIGGDAGTVYEYLGSAADLDLNLQDYSDSTVWKKLAGAGGIYYYMGTEATLDLNAVDYTDQGFWKQKLETTLIPQGNNIPSGDSKTDSDAMAVGIVFAVNDVRSAVEAFINNATVETASLAIEALETAVIRASTESSATAGGGSALGKGSVKALSGTVATNTVLSSAEAYVDNSSVTTSVGDVSLNAENLSLIDAITKALTSSQGDGAAITLAFNSIGWEPTNILFNTVDAILGDSLVAEATNGDQTAAKTEAYIRNSTIDAAGELSLSAINEAQLMAEITTESISLSASLMDTSSKAGGLMLATNKVNSAARAYIENAPSIDAGGAVSVFASDDAGIDAHTKLEVTSTTSNDGGLDIALRLASAYLSEYQFTSNSGPGRQERRSGARRGRLHPVRRSRFRHRRCAVHVQRGRCIARSRQPELQRWQLAAVQQLDLLR
jgi:hypothetical protein